MYCTNCGKEINADNKFCKNCGSIIEREEQEKEAEIVTNKAEEKSMKYYNFYSKYYLLIITIVNIIGLANYQNVEVWNTAVWVILILEVIIYIVVPMKLLNDMQKPTELTLILLIAFLSADYTYKVLTNSFITYNQYSDTSIIPDIIASTIIYGTWFIPNIIYFVKRSDTFKN